MIMEQRESTLQQRSRRDHLQRRRAEETPEQREGRLQRDRQRRERRRAAETQEQREARLMRDRERQGRRRAAPSPLLTLPYLTPPSHHNYTSVPSSSSSSFALDLLCSHLVLSHLIHALRFGYVFLIGALR